MISHCSVDLVDYERNFSEILTRVLAQRVRVSRQQKLINLLEPAACDKHQEALSKPPYKEIIEENKICDAD